MSFDQKKKINLEYDELNIKSHLNTSLDLEGISVSEDLINRTLEAIRKSSEEAEKPTSVETKEVPERKVIPWFKYARNIAVAAAAGLILIVGINGLGQMSSKSDKSGTTAKKAENSAYDTAATGSAAPEMADGSSAGYAGGAAMEFAAQATGSEEENGNYSVDIYTSTKEDRKTSASLQMTEKSDVGVTASSNPDMDDNVEGDDLLLSFRDINPILPEEVVEIAISGNDDEGEVIIKDAEQISSFYQLMETYAYSAGDSFTGQIRYSITIKTNGDLMLLQIDEGSMTAAYSNGGVLVEHCYQINGGKQIIQDLEAWYQANR